MRIQRDQDGIETLGCIVVQKKADTNAAIRRRVQSLEQKRTGHVVLPDVILNIQRPLRECGQKRTRGKGVARILQRIDSGESGMRFNQRRDGLPDSRSRCIE